MRAELIEPSDPRWTSVLVETRHDFYHLPAYTELSARYDEGVARAIMVEDEQGHVLLLPLVLRPLPDGLQDATSPYGYPGPVTNGPDAFCRDAMRAAYDVMAQERIVTLFVRLHPILNHETQTSAGDVVELGETVVIDVSEPEERLWKQMKRSHRQQIQRARKAGNHVFVDKERAHLAAFARMYRETMRRRGAKRYYYFDDAYFEALADALGSRFNLFVLERGGVISAAGIFVETDGVVQSHLSADDPDRTRGGVKKLLYDEVRRWAMERGDRWFHLGGGVGAASDSLMDFKSGFSPSRLPFRSLQVVIRKEDFCRLTEALTHDATGRSVSVAEDDEYFPPYRRP